MGDKEKTDQQRIKELEDRLAALEPPKPFVPERLIRPDLYRNMAPPPAPKWLRWVRSLQKSWRTTGRPGMCTRGRRCSARGD